MCDVAVGTRNGALVVENLKRQQASFSNCHVSIECMLCMISDPREHNPRDFDVMKCSVCLLLLYVCASAQ